MSNTFSRCKYIASDTQAQCSVWYSINEHTDFCILHRNAFSTTLAAMGLNKDSYIEHRDAKAKFCYEMTLAELEVHIAEIERVIEVEKTNLMTARAVKMDKLENLTEEERKERRKIVTPQVVKEEKKKVVTAKNDPVRYMMQLLNCNEAKARETLGLPA